MSSPLTLLVLSTLPSARAADLTGDGIDDLVIGVPYEVDIGGVFHPGAIEVIRGSTSGLTTAGDAFIHQDTAGVTGSNETNEYFGAALGAGDIDGDGKDDVIIGGPGEYVGRSHSGTVWRLELTTTRSSLSVTTSQAYTQDTAGVSDSAEDSDLFGHAIAVADFDGDGYDDVVVGIPGEDVDTVEDAGAIQYLQGSARGLTTSGQLYYNQDSTGMTLVTAEEDDEFGYALAAGDFDADGYADLAVGVPGEDWTAWTDSNEGGVHVLYGSSIGPGVTSPDDELWGVYGSTYDEGNMCGLALAVGDFDNDGYDDLAIGCPGHDWGEASESGGVLVIYGSSSGLDDGWEGHDFWTQSGTGILETEEDGDRFGRELTSGDFDGDGFDDLAIAVPTESYGRYTQNGIVQVLFGSVVRLTDVGDLILAQDAGSSVGGTPEDYEYWGQALTSGDYNDDGYEDLAVGGPFDSDGGATNAGVVNVFYGSASGPSYDVLIHQNGSGIDDASESSDWFGFTLR